MRAVAVDMKFVPGFTNARDLAELVDDIHQQWQDQLAGEEDSGWSGDADHGALHEMHPRFQYLLAVAGSDQVFGFEDESDRACVISDYLPELSK